MKRIGLFLLAALMMGGSAGCSDSNNTGGPVYATEDTPGTTPATPPAPSPASSQEITIAKCLSSKDAVLYGASWCQYTQKQIESFKDGFEYLRYVECTKKASVCQKNGVSAYPTWIIGGTRIVGYRAPTDIASAVGCSW